MRATFHESATAHYEVDVIGTPVGGRATLGHGTLVTRVGVLIADTSAPGTCTLIPLADPPAPPPSSKRARRSLP